MTPSDNNGMSEEHKAALAAGRAEGRAVRNYLEALDASRPKRGRRRTPESIGARLKALEQALDDARSVKKLELIQERLDLQNELDALENTPDLDGLKEAFLKHAKAYAERKGISYAAWRELGVDAARLKEAGISRSM